MTAQIAILNRIAVALAADSAVSIRTSGSSETKVYNSVDKLFSLSHDQPVGVMINGTAEVMGVPVETLIKTFRDSAFARPKPTVAEYASGFFSFLTAELPPDSAMVLNHAAYMIISRLLFIRQRAGDEFLQRPRESKDLEAYLAKRIAHHLSQGLNELRRRKPLPGITAENLPPGLDALAKRATVQVLGDGFAGLADQVAELLTLLMTRDIETSGAVRFVFGGFGTDQKFPAVYAADWDLPLVGGNKVREINDEAIDNDQSAVILPFAQKEMVERFMDGVDNAYNDFVESAMERSILRFTDHLMSRLAGPKPPAALKKEVKSLLAAYMAEFRDEALDFRVGTFRDRVLEVVQYMPKSDLAEMAESLVNLTSIKRRVSAERETVGGPIDVAVVSKNDGFVWIKRKRYFERGINERFFLKQDLQLRKWMKAHGEEAED